MKILVAGTPGVGKTTVCKELSKIYKLSYYDVSKIIVENSLFTEKNANLDTHEFEPKKVRKFIKKNIKESSFVFETHTPVVLKHINFDHVFVINVPLKELQRRLKDRKYSELKIKENIDCEIFNSVGFECEELFENVVYVGDSEKTNEIEEILSQIKNSITV